LLIIVPQQFFSLEFERDYKAADAKKDGERFSFIGLKVGKRVTSF
jgi:hypothetical protein